MIAIVKVSKDGKKTNPGKKYRVLFWGEPGIYNYSGFILSH